MSLYHGWIVQGLYGAMGWLDMESQHTRKAAECSCRLYKANNGGLAYRVIYRRKARD